MQHPKLYQIEQFSTETRKKAKSSCLPNWLLSQSQAEVEPNPKPTWLLYQHCSYRLTRTRVVSWRRGRLIVGVLVQGLNCLGLSLGRGHCCYSWARYLTLTETQEYKWEPANCWGNLTNCGEWPAMDKHSVQGRILEILLTVSCFSYDPFVPKAWFSIDCQK